MYGGTAEEKTSGAAAEWQRTSRYEGTGRETAGIDAAIKKCAESYAESLQQKREK